MAAVDVESIDFDVEISEESDLDIVLASIDESLEIVVTEEDVNTEEYDILDRIPDITFVKEDNVFLVIHEQRDVELTFVKDPVQTTIHKLPPKSSVERAVFICNKCTKNFQLKAIYIKHTDICQGYLPPVRKNRKRQSTGETYQQEQEDDDRESKVLKKNVKLKMVATKDVLQSSEKTEFLSNGKNLLMEILTKASEDPVFNLTIGKKESRGNKAASLAKELVKKEIENQHKEIYEVFGGNVAYWLLPLINTNSENSMVRQSQCRNFLAVGQSSKNRTEWQGFLKALNMEEEGSDILFQFVLCKGYEAALIWKNSVYCRQHDFDPSALEFTKEEEKILRYVAGYIPFSLKKKYWTRRQTPLGKAVLDMVNSWTIKADENRDSKTLYEYTLSWTEKINRGGLMIVNESFFIFVRHVESVARTVLNKSLIINYCGEDLRDVLLEKFLKHDLIDKSWCSLTRYIENDSLKDTIKIAILKKWIGIRARSFVNAWTQLVKRKSGKINLSSKSEPSLRKTLFVKKN